MLQDHYFEAVNYAPLNFLKPSMWIMMDHEDVLFVIGSSFEVSGATALFPITRVST
jgi:hypothetical protein